MRLLVGFLVLVGLGGPLCAQEKGQVGLDAAFDSGPLIGLTYHVTRWLAIRPAVSYTHSSTTQLFDPSVPTMAASRDLSSSGWKGSLSALFFLPKTEGLSPYIGGSYNYAHTSSDSQPVAAPQPYASFFGQTAADTSNGGSAFLGLQHVFGKRFGLFGEAGVSFLSTSHSQTDVPPPASGFPVGTSSQTTHTVGTFTGAVGMIFYFN
jgi:hypothetical protein